MNYLKDNLKTIFIVTTLFVVGIVIFLNSNANSNVNSKSQVFEATIKSTGPTCKKELFNRVIDQKLLVDMPSIKILQIRRPRYYATDLVSLTLMASSIEIGRSQVKELLLNMDKEVRPHECSLVAIWKGASGKPNKSRLLTFATGTKLSSTVSLLLLLIPFFLGVILFDLGLIFNFILKYSSLLTFGFVIVIGVIFLRVLSFPNSHFLQSIKVPAEVTSKENSNYLELEELSYLLLDMPVQHGNLVEVVVDSNNLLALSFTGSESDLYNLRTEILDLIKTQTQVQVTNDIFAKPEETQLSKIKKNKLVLYGLAILYFLLMVSFFKAVKFLGLKQ